MVVLYRENNLQEFDIHVRTYIQHIITFIPNHSKVHFITIFLFIELKYTV